LRLVAQRTQAGDLLAVEVQLRGVLHTQHHRMRCHARAGTLPVRLEQIHAVELLLRQEAIRRLRLCPTTAGTRQAGRWLVGQTLGQQHGTGVEPLVPQIDAAKLLCRPTHAASAPSEKAKTACYRSLLKLCVMECILV
jgi:hypothetical protein